MKLAVIAMVLGSTLVLGGRVAAADAYIDVGIGSGLTVDGSLGSTFATDDSTHGRLALGSRFGAWAIEGAVVGVGFDHPDVPHRIVSGTLDLKLFVPLGERLEGYVKGGIHEATLETDSEAPRDYEGVGHQFGAGLRYGFDAGATSMAVWLDYNRMSFDMAGEPAGGRGGPDVMDGTADLFTVGVSIGI